MSAARELERQTRIHSKKLAIYYGWPSSVNLHYDIKQAATDFGRYDLLVWGSGLESPTHPDYPNVVTLLARPEMKNTQVFGYIDAAVPSLEDIKAKIDAWSALSIAGIFGDQFGYDFNVYRERQNEIVEYVHSKNLLFFANAWNAADALGSDVHVIYNPLGVSTTLNAQDWILAESFGLKNGAFEPSEEMEQRGWALLKYAKDIGIQIASVTTTDASTFDQQKWDYAYFASLLFGFDAQGYGEYGFSASSALLPWRARKPFDGSHYSESVPRVTGHALERRTNVGFRLNTTTHKVDVLLEK